jgi:hypothetical protein
MSSPDVVLPEVGTDTTHPDLKKVVARGARFAVSGLLAGFIGLGVIGLRGTMRLVTITSGGAGRLTEGGNRAGDFTLEGTLFLVIAGTVLGALIAFLYGAIRPALPTNMWLRALLTAPFLARLVMLDPDNVDFIRFAPAWVAIAGFTFGCFVYILTLEAALLWLESRWRLPLWANFILAAPPAGLLAAQGLVGDFGPDVLRLALCVFAAVLLVAWWRRAEWLKHLSSVLAAIWIVGGFAWWVQTVGDLI